MTDSDWHLHNSLWYTLQRRMYTNRRMCTYVMVVTANFPENFAYELHDPY